MKEFKNLPNISEALTPCHVVMIVDRGFSSCFDTCEAVIKDHQVCAYKNHKGKTELLSVRDTDFFRNNDVFDEYSDPRLLLHFEVDGKWGLFSTKTGAIVIEPVWNFIGRVTTDYLHVISTVDKLVIKQKKTMTNRLLRNLTMLPMSKEQQRKCTRTCQKKTWLPVMIVSPRKSLSRRVISIGIRY